MQRFWNRKGTNQKIWPRNIEKGEGTNQKKFKLQIKNLNNFLKRGKGGAPAPQAPSPKPAPTEHLKMSETMVNNNDDVDKLI